MKENRIYLHGKIAPLFFVTNTRAEIDLVNCQLRNPGKGPLVKIGSARWGRKGQNGGTLKLTARNQKLEGDIDIERTLCADKLAELVPREVCGEDGLKSPDEPNPQNIATLR